MSIVYFFKVIAVARTADLVVMMLDATKGDKQKELLTAELESVGIRLNKKRPGKKKKTLRSWRRGTVYINFSLKFHSLTKNKNFMWFR